MAATPDAGADARGMWGPNAWLDGSSPPAKHHFVFPRNRSSASTNLPNSSSSPIERDVGEGGGVADALRRELMRVYDTNAELREQIALLKTRVEREGATPISGGEQRWRMRCGELEELLRTERRRCEEKDRIISALQEALHVTRNITQGFHTPCFDNGAPVTTKNVSKKELVNDEGRRQTSFEHFTGTHPILQEELTALKLGVRQERWESTDSLVSERLAATRVTPRGHDISMRFRFTGSPTVGRSLDTGSEMKKKAAVLGENGYSCYSATPTLGNSGERTNLFSERRIENEAGGLSVSTTPPSSNPAHMLPASSSRAFVPQTLADLTACVTAASTSSDEGPCCDGEEFGKVVSLPRALRLGMGVSLQKLLDREQTRSL